MVLVGNTVRRQLRQPDTDVLSGREAKIGRENTKGHLPYVVGNPAPSFDMPFDRPVHRLDYMTEPQEVASGSGRFVGVV